MTNRTCSVDGCGKLHFGRGWCQTHYTRMRRNGSLEVCPREQKFCNVAGCDAPLVPPHGRGMCSMHYKRFMKHGDPNYVRPVIVGVAECSIDGCRGIVQARGWCSKHWTRWHRYGDAEYRFPFEGRDGRRVCPGCGIDKLLAEYSRKRTDRCRACLAARARARRKIKPDPRVVGRPKSCKCGETFMANGRRRRYCSDECYAEYRHKDNWPNIVKRRARLRKAFVESFKRDEIFRRDGWVCQICLEPVDRDASYPDPYMASLDHIIPLAKGGKHSRANAQTTHLICNVRKGDRIVT